MGVAFANVTAVRQLAADSNRPLWGVGTQVARHSEASGPAIAEAGAEGSETGREDGALHYSLEADKAQGAPRLPQAHFQAEEAVPPSGDLLRPPGKSRSLRPQAQKP